MRRGLVVVALVLVGCSTPAATYDAMVDGRTDASISDDLPPIFTTGPAMTLAASPGADEDPAVISDRGNSALVAWFSESAGNDIVISQTTDGQSWSSPVHVTSGPALDFGPSLFLDGNDGTYHVVWFRWDNGASPPGHIMHNHSADGLTWDAATEVPVTTVNASDDWLPTITQLPDRTLLVAYARNTCPPPDECYAIYTSTSADGDTWSSPELIVAANGSEEQHAPALSRNGDELMLVWDPFDTAADAPWDSTTTGAHVDTMRFVPGTGWTDRRSVTTRDPAAVTLLPTIYDENRGGIHVAWLAADASEQSVVEIPRDDIGTATPNVLPFTGYSPKITATPDDGTYLAAWVEGPPSDRAIAVQVFTH